MARPSGDDKDAIDRAFAELIAGFHLTADPRTGDHDQEREPHTDQQPATEEPGERRRLDLDSRWAEEHPLFSYSPPAEPEPREIEDDFEPGPPPPWPRPSAAVLVGWIGVAFAVITMIAAALGAPVPRWTGWMAVGGFVAGLALLFSRLPRQRPPDSGDGAML